MTRRAQELLREALTLPAEERADVASELLASLEEPPADDPAVVQAAWAREIEQRAQRAMSGGSSGESWDTIRERIAERLTAR